MTNTLTVLMPKILARVLPVLRNQCVMPNLVYKGHERDKKQKGQTVTIPLSAALTVGDVSPSQYGPDPSALTPTSVNLTLNKWRNVNFYATDKELEEVDADQNFIPSELEEGIAALANDVNSYILGLYPGIYGYVGTAGTTPFQTNARAITSAKKVLNQQKCPNAERFAVLDNSAAEEVLNLSSFADASQTGENKVKIEGEMGRKYGFNFFEDNQVVSHTAGSDAGAATINTSTVEPVGETSLSVKAVGGTLALLAGDIITIAGDTQTYAVYANVSITSGNTGTVVVSPGLKVATSGDEAITIKSSHVVNMAFNRNAIAFASAPMDDKWMKESGAIMTQMADPLTGIVLRLELKRQNKRVVWELDILYGAALIQAERACRIAG